MFTTDGPTSSRRRFLKLGGGGLALIPLVNLVGCSDDSTPQAAPEKPAAETSKPAGGAQSSMPAEPAATEAPASEPSMAAGTQPAAELTRLEESEPTAVALGYKHDATQVDTSKFPRYQAGQHCAVCTLFQPDASGDPGWGACSIFPGKLVNANGWCSAFVAKT